MKLSHITPILNVSDVPASLAWFEKLGWTRSFTWNNAGQIQNASDDDEHGKAQFAGVCAGDCQIFLCCNGQGSRGGSMPKHVGDDDTGGVWMSWWVASPADVDDAHSPAVQNGITVSRPPTDEPWGVRECRIMHPEGHTFRISSGLGDATAQHD